MPRFASKSFTKYRGGMSRGTVVRGRKKLPTPKEPYSLSLEIIASIYTSINVIISTSDIKNTFCSS
jgi:hypothetical protein